MRLAAQTRSGLDVLVTEACVARVWIVKSSRGITWEYKPRMTGPTTYELPVWVLRAKYADDGAPVCDGKWVCINEFSDYGMMLQICKQLAPDVYGQYIEWEAGKLTVTAFPVIEEKDVA